MMALLFSTYYSRFLPLSYLNKQKLALWFYWIALVFGCYLLFHHVDFGTLKVSL